MFRVAGPRIITIEIGAFGPKRGFVELDVTDMAVVRADVMATVTEPDVVEFGFLFTCSPESTGEFFEANASDRIVIPASQPVPPPNSWSSAQVNCKGFARVRLQPVGVNPLTLANVTGYARLTAFSTVKIAGRLPN